MALRSVTFARKSLEKTKQKSYGQNQYEEKNGFKSEKSPTKFKLVLP